MVYYTNNVTHVPAVVKRKNPFERDSEEWLTTDIDEWVEQTVEISEPQGKSLN